MGLRIQADPVTAFGPADIRQRLWSRAFSLTDLLVSISVMALLIAILLPSLASATEQTRRVRCSTQMRQVGLGLQMYSFEQRDELPPSIYESGAQNQANEMIVLRLPGSAGSAPQWDSLGVLFELNYLSHPGAFYCPSHHGFHSFSVYADAWAGRSPGRIMGNMHYRVPPTRSLSELSSFSTLVADGMRRRSDYNHEIGNNYLKADLSVGWFYDRTGLLQTNLVADSVGPAIANDAVERCWDVLDTIAPGSDTAFDPTTMPSNQIPMVRGQANDARPSGQAIPNR